MRIRPGLRYDLSVTTTGQTAMKTYSKPLFQRAVGIDFVMFAIKAGWRTVCRQCSSCHGCR